MSPKTEYLQIRISPRQKALLKRAAAAGGQDVSTYVLARALPEGRMRFQELVASLATDADHRFVLAELNDLLTPLSASELRETVEHAALAPLPPLLQNYVAAMVEHAANRRGIIPPGWLRAVPPLEQPYFATSLRSLRLHLLRTSPVAFKRRNLFVDASLGARV